MKLQPRVRRPRSDFIVDNAALMGLGKLYLGWGSKKKSSRRKLSRSAPVAESKAKAKAPTTKATSKTTSKAPSLPKSVKTSPRKPVKKTLKHLSKPGLPAAKRPSPAKPSAAKRSPKAAAPPFKRMPTKGDSRARSLATPTKVPSKKITPKREKPTKQVRPAVMPISSKMMAAAGAAAAAASMSTSAKMSSKPLPRNTVSPALRASSRTAAAPPIKTAAPRHRKPKNNVPPVIPNPVPTPALSLGAAVQTFDSNAVSVLVRTMNGTSFRLACTTDTTLFDLKRRILEIIMPWTSPASTGSVVRLPMLVMNGRALEPENATLDMLRFSSESTVYCFPEPA